MIVKIKGTTDAIITFNKSARFLRGAETIDIDIKTTDQANEVEVLRREKLIQIIQEEELTKKDTEKVQREDSTNKNENISDESPKVIKKVGRPKKVIAEDKVIIASEEGIKSVNIKKNIIEEHPILETSAVEESLKAEKEMIEREAEEAKDREINEKELNPSERMGEDAVVFTGETSKRVKMVNNMVPNAEEIKNRNPFIEEQKNEKDPALIDLPYQEDSKEEIGDDFFLE